MLWILPPFPWVGLLLSWLVIGGPSLLPKSSSLYGRKSMLACHLRSLVSLAISYVWGQYCIGVKINLSKSNINLSKSNLNVLQAATIVDSRAALQMVFQECSTLAELPQVAEGFTCVDAPVNFSVYNSKNY